MALNCRCHGLWPLCLAFTNVKRQTFPTACPEYLCAACHKLINNECGAKNVFIGEHLWWSKDNKKLNKKAERGKWKRMEENVLDAKSGPKFLWISLRQASVYFRFIKMVLLSDTAIVQWLYMCLQSYSPRFKSQANN